MIILPLVVVLVAVGIISATRHRHAHVLTDGSTQVAAHHTTPVTPLGRWSLIVLAAAFVLWAFTRTTLPIYYAAALGAISFALAVVAGVQSHDRSPLLLIPLLFVPLAAVSGAAFVLLQ